MALGPGRQRQGVSLIRAAGSTAGRSNRFYRCRAKIGPSADVPWLTAGLHEGTCRGTVAEKRTTEQTSRMIVVTGTISRNALRKTATNHGRNKAKKPLSHAHKQDSQCRIAEILCLYQTKTRTLQRKNPQRPPLTTKALSGRETKKNKGEPLSPPSSLFEP